MSFLLVTNESLPEWPVFPAEFVKRKKQILEGKLEDLSPEEKEVRKTYLKEVSKLQTETPWLHCQNSDNLSYRRAVLELVFPYLTDLRNPDVMTRTVPWVEGVCPKIENLPGNYVSEFRYSPYRDSLLGPTRVVFIKLVQQPETSPT